MTPLCNDLGIIRTQSLHFDEILCTFGKAKRRFEGRPKTSEESVTPRCDSLDIIRMQSEHFDEILRIEAEAFKTPWSIDDFEHGLREDKGGYAVVALIGDALIGYAVGITVFEEFHLANLAIRHDWRRRGYGRCLLDRVLQDVQQVGVLFVTLEVRMSNRRAVELYRGNGFRNIAIRKDYYRRPKEDALVMMRVLENGLFYNELEERHGLA